jgi:hypothetical protein
MVKCAWLQGKRNTHPVSCTYYRKLPLHGVTQATVINFCINYFNLSYLMNCYICYLMNCYVLVLPGRHQVLMESESALALNQVRMRLKQNPLHRPMAVRLNRMSLSTVGNLWTRYFPGTKFASILIGWWSHFKMTRGRILDC